MINQFFLLIVLIEEVDIRLSSPQRTQSFIYLMKRRLKGCSSLSYICFPLRKSAIICVSIKIQTLWNSVLLCGEIHSKPHSNEDDGPVFSVAEVPLNGIDPLVRCCTLAFSERNVPFPGTQSCFTCTCKAARDAHVVLYEMHMSYRFTCTSKTTLHTEAQGRRIKMRCPVKVLTGIFHPILLSAF